MERSKAGWFAGCHARVFLRACRAALVLAVSIAARAIAAEQPNIIVLYTDDQAYRMTGFEGNTQIKTPNLDRLAAESVQFTRCYVPTPQCAPSRASLLTGQYPHVHGVTTNGPELSKLAETFTARLKKAGYACGIVGKWHLGDVKKPGFGLTDFVATNEKPESEAGWSDCKTWVQGQEGRTEKYLTDWQIDRAIEAVERLRGKPFFLWVCFNAPHEPLAWPPGMEQLYPPAGVELPASMRAPTSQKNATWDPSPPPTNWPAKLQQCPAAQRFRQAQGNPQALREARAKYMAMITRVDQQIGRLLERLGELKLDENTTVVFTSDNGWCIGEHALFGKGPAFYDELIRMPLLIRYPRLGTGHAQVSRVVSTVDLAPTFCELAGLEPGLGMQGESLVRLMRAARRTPVTSTPAQASASATAPAGPLVATSTAPEEEARVVWTDERFLEYDRQPATPAAAPSVAPSPASGQPGQMYRPAPVTMPGQPGHLYPPSTTRMGAPLSTTGPHQPGQPGFGGPTPPPEAPPVAGQTPQPGAPAGSGQTYPPGTPGAAGQPAAPATPGMAAAPAGQPAQGTPNAEGRVWGPQPEFVDPARGIVTARYKFIHYLQDSDMLFDLKRDPQEMDNLIQAGNRPQPQYIQVFKVFSDRLTRWRKVTHDPVP